MEGKKQKTKPSHDTLESREHPVTHTSVITDEATKINNPYKKKSKNVTYLAEDEYFVTALVPSDTACFASSPGRISRTLT